MKTRISSIKSERPEEARKPKAQVARERKAAGLPYDESRLPPGATSSGHAHPFAETSVRDGGMPCGSGWTGDRCTKPLGHRGRHSNDGPEDNR